MDISVRVTCITVFITCLGRHIHLLTAHCGHTEFTSCTATHITIRSLYHRPALVQDRATDHQLHRQTVRTSGKAASRYPTTIFAKNVSVYNEKFLSNGFVVTFRGQCWHNECWHIAVTGRAFTVVTSSAPNMKKMLMKYSYSDIILATYYPSNILIQIEISPSYYTSLSKANMSFKENIWQGAYVDVIACKASLSKTYCIFFHLQISRKNLAKWNNWLLSHIVSHKVCNR